ncbi:hypothetical protein HGRIS_002179 [Hohenbuehelia grisea]|uniref:Uncharacterized protein n=1 Tax=Hohenbuehelia grisea TaxID=104357 RepID=A0ABR3JL33_9AGAR
MAGTKRPRNDENEPPLITIDATPKPKRAYRKATKIDDAKLKAMRDERALRDQANRIAAEEQKRAAESGKLQRVLNSINATSSQVSNTLGAHMKELMDHIHSRQPDKLDAWASEQQASQIATEAANLAAYLRPAEGKRISDLLAPRIVGSVHI